ncbi:MAG: ABC transporter ATP-binding protein [Myxococcales bacterium]|nr:ABC transporter ATP-binding protein [Myxococcales bacterium]
MLRVEDVTKKYGDFTAVANLNLALDAGRILGFLGPNGAGKTTTMKMVCGLIAPTGGCITIDGHDITRAPLAAKAVLGYVPDRPYLHERLTALEYLYFVAGLYRLPRDETLVRANALLDLFGLTEKRTHLIESFSHGMKQRLVMASVLLHRPKLLVVDEPMVGLDPRGARLLKDVLRREARENGLAVMLSTHTLEVADEVCDTVAVIHRGRLVAQGSGTELRERAGAASARLEEVFLQLTEEEAAPPPAA